MTADDPSADPTVPDRDDTPPADRPRILLADDNADMRAYVQRLLEERFAVTAVADGEAALAAALEHPPDLLLADVMMPAMDGLELLRRLRASPYTRSVPVILLSARAGEEASVEGLEAGAVDYLVKPFSAGELLARVQALVSLAKLRRQAAEELRQAEETQATLAAIVQSSDDAIVSKSLDGVIRSWNAGAERLFGYTAEQALGRHISLIIPADRAEEETEILARLCEGQRVDHFETVRRRRDGRMIEVSLTISPVKDGSGRIIGASKIARDITPAKQAAAALKEADRRKDEFLATLAHELRNPLAPIRNSLEIMKQSLADPGRLRQSYETIERQLAHLVRMVDDLLDVSRITRNRMELRFERVELAAVMQSAVETSRPLIEAAENQLTVALPAEPVLLDADPVRLAQIFSNLLNNAARYSDRGGHIRIDAEREADAIVVRVSDDGVGIPAGALAQIFDMFVQVDPAQDRSRGGLGIGLTLVHRLVEMHGGTVEARSDGPGKGSEFIVRLPPAAAQAAAAAGEQAAESAPPAAPRLRRILVVDDNHDSADSLSQLLSLLGYESAAAYDGLSAIDLIPGFRPDVVLLDLGMPKLTGFDVARRIRERWHGEPIVLVALTGWGQEEDRRQTQEAGFDHHLVKPVELPALEALLRQEAGAPKPA